MPSKSKGNLWCCSEFLMAWECLRHDRQSPTRPPSFSRFSVPHQLCQNHPPERFYQLKASHVLRVQIHKFHVASASLHDCEAKPSQPSFGWPKPTYYTCRDPLAPKPLWLAHRVQLLPEVVADRCLFKCQWRLMETYRCLYVMLEHYVYSIL